MSRKNRSPEEKARRAKIRELLQMANIDSMDDIQDLFKETIAEFMENGLEAELDEDLGYSKYDYKNDDSLLKMLYLAMMDITKKWTGRRQDWSRIHAQLSIYFAERMPD